MPAEPSGPSRRFEIAAILVIAGAVLALVSLYSDAAGVIGNLIAQFLRYMFGQLAAAPSVLIIAWAIASFRRRDQGVSSRKLLAVGGLYAIALAAFHLAAGEPVPPRFDALRSFSSATPGGGVIGGLTSFALVAAFGRNGSVVVLIAATLSFVILYMDSPFARFIERVMSLIARLIRSVFLGGGDFVRGLMGEMNDLIGLIKDRSILRRESRATPAAARAQSTAEQPSLLARLFTKRRPDVKASAPTPRRPESAGAAAVNGTRSKAALEPKSAATTAIAVSKSAPPVVMGNGEVAEVGGTDSDFDDSEAELDPAEPTGASRRPVRRLTEGSAPTELPVASEQPHAYYRLPPTAMLERPKEVRGRQGKEQGDQAVQLEETLARFGIEAKVVQVSHGPAVTRYELQPAPGIKVKQITSLADDLALALAAAGIRIEAPVPGKSVVGIEVPNKETSTVYLREVIESDAFQEAESKLVMALGKDITGNPVVADLRRLLHLLIAGATGSGKSVCINTIVTSILYKALPHEVKLLMIDPKRVELAVYDGIPHLVSPVVTDPKQAAGALKWAVREMEQRYTRFSEVGARNIDGYNQFVEAQREAAEAEGLDAEAKAALPTPLPLIVIIIDELADLMMVAQHDVEDSICRLAQMARAAGLHLIIATQRPSVDVITGLIKANVPSRISFAVSSSHDSRTILDMVGAERLLGKGDMLFYPSGSNKPSRAQGALISDKEVQELVEFWKDQGSPEYQNEVLTERASEVTGDDEADDELFDDAVRLVMDTETASISMLQRRFRIGYSRAARLIDMMELKGYVGPYQGSKPREVLRQSVGDAE